ncbi:MAG TPA: hypothetical protein VFM63_09020 [Pyrinomonadaceae bacterium]|nr:hypothetical protein [Pyrinomonadaceae bacterium]
MSLLTAYRPNFCCECGEKIVRLRWRLWTSRKFCDRCFGSSGRSYWLQRAAAIVILLLAGILIGRGVRREPPPLIIERPVQPPSQATTVTDSQPAPSEHVYTCGARTKKGKPCSRRVHGPARCWQHKGMPAMLPPEKLIINE